MTSKKASYTLFLVLTFLLNACTNQATPVVTTPTLTTFMEQTPTTESSHSTTPVNTVEPTAIPVDVGYPTPEEFNSDPSGAYPAAGDSNEPTAQVGPPTAPVEAPEPTTGNGSVSGAIYSFTTNQTVRRIRYYLTPGAGADEDAVPFVLVGPDEEEGDITGETDENGQFAMDSVPPGNYYLVVWAPPYSWEVVQKSDTDPAPLMIEVSAGEKHLLGILNVSWP